MSDEVIKAVETVEVWVDAWEDEQAEVEEVSPCDQSEREVIKAVRIILIAAKLSERPPANRPRKSKA